MSMDALEFFKGRKRMCRCYEGCIGCPLEETGCASVVSSLTSDADYMRIVATVEQWSKEHPIKTRQSVFLKMFPRVILNDKGQPGFCPKMLDTGYKPVGGCVLDVDICQRCMDKFWGQEVE